MPIIEVESFKQGVSSGKRIIELPKKKVPVKKQEAPKVATDKSDNSKEG